MKNKLLKPSPESILAAAETLKSGELVAFPTETVYGLGADACNEAAVKRIYYAKNRPVNNPLIVHVVNLNTARSIAEFSKIEISLAKEFWPGPLTLILNKCSSSISDNVTAGLPTVGVRVPKNAIALSLLKAFGGPIAAPSANKSGEVSPTLAKHTFDIGKSIQNILDGDHCEIGLESTIVKCQSDKIKILREGAITKEQIQRFISINFPKFHLSTECSGSKIIAPGQSLAHYSPKSKIRLNISNPSSEDIYLSFGPMPTSARGFSLSEKKSLDEAAKNLYNFLRRADELILSDKYNKWHYIAVAPIPKIGLGASINDRLFRASSLKL